MSNRMPKILTSPTKNAREVVNPEIICSIVDLVECVSLCYFSGALSSKSII